MDSVVRDALEAAARRDWETLGLKLHPYVRWKLASGKTLNGRNAQQRGLKTRAQVA
jgi:hypothetical protein